eukprot:scaffold4187_cov57-Phaeocystis_antarctica.AAC.8
MEIRPPGFLVRGWSQELNGSARCSGDAEKLWNESVSGTREAWAAREARAARETVGVGEAGGRARRGRRGRRGGPRPPPSELELERACAAYSEALTAKLPIEAHASGCAVRHTGLEPRTSRPQTGATLPCAGGAFGRGGRRAGPGGSVLDLAPRTLAAGGARPVALLLRARRAGRRSYTWP